MRGERCPAPSPSEGSELHAYVNIPGLNRAASQELFWPSRVGRCEGRPHIYVRMPFDLLSAAIASQCRMRDVLANREDRHQVILAEMEMDPHEATGPPEPPEAQGQGGS